VVWPSKNALKFWKVGEMPKAKRTVFDEAEAAEEALADADVEEVEGEEAEHKDKEKKKRKRKRAKAESSSVDEAKEDSQSTKSSALPSSSSLASSLANDRTVYIEGLPFESNETQVRAFFASVKSGVILSVRLPTWHDSGKLRGYGHVEFSKAEAAKDALKLDGSHMGKRFIKVTTPMVPRLLQQQQDPSTIKGPAGCRSIFVKNLPYDTTEEEISEAFKVFGKIRSVRIPMWAHTSQQKGVAYLDFQREDSAEIAVKKSAQMTIRGRPLVVDFETGAPKASFKQQGATRKL